MGVAFTPSQLLGRGDLDIFLSNGVGNNANAYQISYAVYYVDPGTEAEVLIGSDSRIPVNPAVGEYYAALMIPPTAVCGNYRIRWTFKELAGNPDQQVVQEFAVVASTTNVTSTSVGNLVVSACVADLIHKLRVLLRDNNPDSFYNFRPPQGEGEIGCYNQVNGYIWNDEELLEYLNIALWKWNMQAPATPELCTIDQLCQSKPAWKAALLWGALVNAAQAAAYNSVANEFSITPSQEVTVYLPDGGVISLPIQELYSICYGGL